MRLLALETTSRIFSLVTLESEEPTVHEIHKEVGRGHAEILFPQIRKLLRKAGWTLTQVEALAVGKGPGSFTGVRVGLSAARALSHVLRIPLVGVSSLEGLAQNLLPEKGWILTVIYALREEFYSALYWSDGSTLSPVFKETLFTREALAGLVKERIGKDALFLAGDGLLEEPKKWKQCFGKKVVFAKGKALLPRARSIAMLAKKRLEAGERPSFGTVMPEYLRPALAESRLEERLGITPC